MQVLEWCIEKDSLNEWVFDREEIFDIINYFMCYIVKMYLCILFY